LERYGLLLGRLVAADRDEYECIAARGETQAIGGAIGRHFAGLRIECKGGVPVLAVETLIGQHSLGSAGHASGGGAAMLTR
jgi:hypothetical protein